MREALDSHQRHAQEPLSFVVSLLFDEAQAPARLGHDAYSYYFAFAPLRPLLARYGDVLPLTKPESRLDYALWRLEEAGVTPVHISFLPLQYTYLTSRAANVAFPFWEFPEIPHGRELVNPRDDWKRLAERLDLILCASSATREAFLRAGVRTPIHVVPIPVRREYLTVPPWDGRPRRIACPAYVLGAKPNAGDPEPQGPVRAGWIERMRPAYRTTVRPYLPIFARQALSRGVRLVRLLKPPPSAELLFQPEPALHLTGVVYTSILNVQDPRKNWTDLVSAFLIGLRERDDATLVIKLVAPAGRVAEDFARIHALHDGLAVRHRCKLVVAGGYFSDAQMHELIRGSTYYVNTSHAEGACLPLQEFLASGRPAIAPRHSAMVDYFDDAVGFVVESHPEPAAWPHLPEQGYVTTRHRLVWQSLCDQFRTSYAIAKTDMKHYRALARHARERMQEFAGEDRVAACLGEALGTLYPELGTTELCVQHSV